MDWRGQSGRGHFGGSVRVGFRIRRCLRTEDRCVVALPLLLHITSPVKTIQNNTCHLSAPHTFKYIASVFRWFRWQNAILLYRADCDVTVAEQLFKHFHHILLRCCHLSQKLLANPEHIQHLSQHLFMLAAPVRSAADIETTEGYKPEFTHQVVGPSETIVGYKSPKVTVYYTSGTLNTYISVNYAEICRDTDAVRFPLLTQMKLPNHHDLQISDVLDGLAQCRLSTHSAQTL